MLESLKPLRDYVLVKRLKDNEKTESGIFIPQDSQDKSQTALVVAVGTGRVTADGLVIPLEVKAGDIIFFNKYSGIDAGNDHLMMKEEDILGIVE